MKFPAAGDYSPGAGNFFIQVPIKNKCSCDCMISIDEIETVYEGVMGFHFK